ncbi:hypothetical protein ACTID9_06355 [Brevibacillus fluminis]|uniref:hypothetical protein n=1 Tax=Brevibacillus fluminis TaxID=511487 RepID=UPI003F897FB7
MNVFALFLPGGLFSLLAALFHQQPASWLFHVGSIIIGVIELGAVAFFSRKNPRFFSSWWKPVSSCLVLNLFANLLYLGLWRDGLL